MFEALIRTDPLTPLFESHRWFVATALALGRAIRAIGDDETDAAVVDVLFATGTLARLTRRRWSGRRCTGIGRARCHRRVARGSIRDDAAGENREHEASEHDRAAKWCQKFDRLDDEKAKAGARSVGSGLCLDFFFQCAFSLVLLGTAAVFSGTTTGAAQAPVGEDQANPHSGGDQAKNEQGCDEGLHAASSRPLPPPPLYGPEGPPCVSVR